MFSNILRLSVTLQEIKLHLIVWTDRVDACSGVQARLSCSEITEDLEGISGAALVRVNPVLSCRRKVGLKNL